MFPTWTLTLLLGIIVILIVFFKLNLTKQPSPTVEKTPDEDTLALLLEEWQKENDALLRALTEMQHDVVSRLSTVQDRVALLEAKIGTDNETAPGTAANSTAEERRGTDFQHRYAEISAMAENGMSVVDIARKTGRGNGEIQLILGLTARGQTHE